MHGKKEILTKRYEEQKYSVFFNKKTGYFVRAEDKGVPAPLWSEHGPELLDISITNWCDNNCAFCYRQSTAFGKHMSVGDYEFVIRQGKGLDVLQVALGGGNPNQHPEFVKILELTVENGIVPCYTTSGRGLTDYVIGASRELCGSVAISAHQPYEEFRYSLEKLCKYGIKVNVHFVTNSRSIDTAIEWLREPPTFLDGINSLIFLNYKPIGRRPKYSLILKDPDKLQTFYSLVGGSKNSQKIGFDSCSVSGVVKHLDVNSNFYEGCDAGRFSAFVDENLRMFPCSFMNGTNWYGDLREEPMVDVWKTNQFFQEHRARIISNGCTTCQFQKTCMGGCPFIEELSQCGWKDERLQGEPHTEPLRFVSPSVCHGHAV